MYRQQRLSSYGHCRQSGGCFPGCSTFPGGRWKPNRHWRRLPARPIGRSCGGGWRPKADCGFRRYEPGIGSAWRRLALRCWLSATSPASAGRGRAWLGESWRLPASWACSGRRWFCQRRRWEILRAKYSHSTKGNSGRSPKGGRKPSSGRRSRKPWQISPVRHANGSAPGSFWFAIRSSLEKGFRGRACNPQSDRARGSGGEAAFRAAVRAAGGHRQAMRRGCA